MTVRVMLRVARSSPMNAGDEVWGLPGCTAAATGPRIPSKMGVRQQRLVQMLASQVMSLRSPVESAHAVRR